MENASEAGLLGICEVLTSVFVAISIYANGKYVHDAKLQHSTRMIGVIVLHIRCYHHIFTILLFNDRWRVVPYTPTAYSER